MKFTPEHLKLSDVSMQPFLDDEEIWSFIHTAKPSFDTVEAVIAKSLAKNRLTLAETAILVNANEPAMIEMIKAGARALKEKVYGKRIVLFAPLYVGNYCSNNCRYCGFKASNKKAIRKTSCDIRKIQRSRTRAAQACSFLHDFSHHAEVLRKVIVLAEGETSGDETAFQFCSLRDAQSAVV